VGVKTLEATTGSAHATRWLGKIMAFNKTLTPAPIGIVSRDNQIWINHLLDALDTSRCFDPTDSITKGRIKEPVERRHGCAI
jgi:hypothetical protein